MNLTNVIPVLIGAAIGGLVTWLVSRHYYKRAGDELRREATELRRLTHLVLHGLENAGLVKLKRDATGRVTGLIIEIRASLAGSGMMVASGEVTQHQSPSDGCDKSR